MKIDRNYDDNNFTSLRLLLALLVVFGHYQNFIGIFHPAWPYNYAAAAVDCFFVVSGYLVTNSLDRDPNHGRYFIRRFFRIYPLYLAVIVAQALILGSLEPAGFIANTGSLLRYLAFNAVFANFIQHDIGQGVLKGLVDPSLNASLWTLKIEVGFYLILPLIWWAVRRFGVVVLVIIFGLSAAYQIYFDHVDNHQLAKQLPGQLQFFVIGVAAYMYRYRLPTFGPIVGTILAVGLAGLATALLIPHPPIIYPLVIGAFVIIAVLATPRIPLKNDISYGVYLLHAPVIQLSLLFGLYRPDWIGLLATIAIVVTLALIVERAIEIPGIALGKRLARKIGQTHRPAPASEFSDSGLTVVILNDFCYVQGGASKVAIDEAIGLAKAGINVVFLGAVGPVCQQLLDAPLRVECLDQRELLEFGQHPLTAIQAIWNRPAARRMRAILGALPHHYTIVHLHGYTKALTTSPVRVAHRMGYRVVCTLHDFFAACPNGAFFDYAKGQPCMKRALSVACLTTDCDKRHYAHKIYRVVRGYGQRWLGRFPAMVGQYISLSDKSASVLAPYLPAQAQLHTLPNLIDVAHGPSIRAADNHTILCVGRLDAEKGVRLLAEAGASLGLPLRFVGDGPLRAEIEAIPGMTVTGWLSREEVFNELGQARCLVFPSIWYETYGLTVTEAAARGIPAIVSDITAAAERVVDGVTGWHFRSGELADLIRCLKFVENDRAVDAASIAAYRAFWLSPNTADTHTEKLVEIYRLALCN